VAAAVARGIRRYVILGAGLDTFAYRNPFSVLRVIEVDQPATQAWKRAQLAEAGITPPINASFVSIDFATEDLGDVLRRQGLSAGTSAIFSWLGVTPYLERDVVTRTLTAIGRLAGPGGGVVFDYGVPPAGLDSVRRAALQVLMDRLEAIGEPWRTFYEPANLAVELGRCGFRHVKDWASDELNATYFSGRTDGLKVGALGRIVVAHT